MSFDNYINVSYFNFCSIVFVVVKDFFIFSFVNLGIVFKEISKLLVIFDWMIGIDKCVIVWVNGNFLCKGNSVCDDLMFDVGY